MKISVNSNETSTSLTLVFLLFLGLKLAQVGVVATWSWWWVTSPLWIGLAIILAVVGVYVVCRLAVRFVGWPFNKYSNWKKQQRAAAREEEARKVREANTSCTVENRFRRRL